MKIFRFLVGFAFGCLVGYFVREGLKAMYQESWPVVDNFWTVLPILLPAISCGIASVFGFWTGFWTVLIAGVLVLLCGFLLGCLLAIGGRIVAIFVLIALLVPTGVVVRIFFE